VIPNKFKEVFNIVKLPVQLCLALLLLIVGTNLFHFVTSAFLFVATVLEYYQREDQKSE
jgi:hypothetical protein